MLKWFCRHYSEIKSTNIKNISKDDFENNEV